MDYGNYAQNAANLAKSYFNPNFKSKALKSSSNKFLGNVSLKPALQTLSFATVIAPLTMGIVYGASVALSKLHARLQTDDLKGISPHEPSKNLEKEESSPSGSASQLTDGPVHNPAALGVEQPVSAVSTDKSQRPEKEVLKAKFARFEPHVTVYNQNRDGSYDVQMYIPLTKMGAFSDQYGEDFENGRLDFKESSLSADRQSTLYKFTISAEGAKMFCQEESSPSGGAPQLTDDPVHSQAALEVEQPVSAVPADRSQWSGKELLKAKFARFEQHVTVYDQKPDGSYDVQMYIPLTKVSEFSDQYGEDFENGRLNFKESSLSADRQSTLYRFTVSTEGAEMFCQEERLK